MKAVRVSMRSAKAPGRLADQGWCAVSPAAAACRRASERHALWRRRSPFVVSSRDAKEKLFAVTRCRRSVSAASAPTRKYVHFGPRRSGAASDQCVLGSVGCPTPTRDANQPWTSNGCATSLISATRCAPAHTEPRAASLIACEPSRHVHQLPDGQKRRGGVMRPGGRWSSWKIEVKISLSEAQQHLLLAAWPNGQGIRLRIGRL